jgi:hypothetical protein
MPCIFGCTGYGPYRDELPNVGRFYGTIMTGAIGRLIIALVVSCASAVGCPFCDTMRATEVRRAFVADLGGATLAGVFVPTVLLILSFWMYGRQRRHPQA